MTFLERLQQIEDDWLSNDLDEKSDAEWLLDIVYNYKDSIAFSEKDNDHSPKGHGHGLTTACSMVGNFVFMNGKPIGVATDAPIYTTEDGPDSHEFTIELGLSTHE